MTAPRFDELIHAPLRLRIMAMLDAAAGDVEFAVLRGALGVSDSVLSKHLRSLGEADYVELLKTTTASRVYTWVALTRTGRRAYRGHVAALRAIVGDEAAAVDASTTRVRPPAGFLSVSKGPAGA